ncbi:integrase [Neorhizobium galegae]|uniref:hypothetical protein n=1 Tax=Neorhizobium galegae TaxID=399 RepID=UPI001AEA1487|nr:hypothetical protein [Neorhizobium galegae]MBP2558354.1 integrase [Neorhizobium galegae]
MTRDVLTSTLAALSAELADAKRQASSLNIQMAKLQASRREAYHEEQEYPNTAGRLERLTKHVGPLYERKKQLAALQERLGRIGQALASDKTAWESERATYESVVGLLGRIERQIAVPAPAAALEPVPEPEADERAFKPSTLLSVAGRAILDARKDAVNPSGKSAPRYEDRLETAFTAFLEIIGDKPLTYYLPIHMQDFATFLARVPTNRSKIALFKGLTLEQTVEKNAKLPLDQRKPCMSETTVASYLSEVKNIWSRFSAGVPGLRDMGAYRVSMPKDTVSSIDREPMAIPSLNIWLRDAATPKLMKKPHKAWLPLAGLLTGMRLTELIYLQRTDIVDAEGNEVIDLTRPLRLGGQDIDRPVKTKTSKRYVAIHPLLHECGFIEYAKNVKSPDGFVFSHFHTADDPADAAQKQMYNWMNALGIHKTQRQVFHSLRHSAKDWFRDHVGERLADKQCGHAFSGVSANYGAKLLKPKEVRQIMAMPPPEGVDFSEFTKFPPNSY